MIDSTKQTYLLCIETSTDVCSVALAREQICVASRQTNEFKSHSEKITLFIQEVLEEAKVDIQDLDAVAISNGPGSFTGLRIGASTAKGLCFGIGIPLIAINSLYALLRSIGRDRALTTDNALLVGAIDARRTEVYILASNFDYEKVIPTQAIILDEVDNILNTEYKDRRLIVAGNGAEKMKNILGDRVTIFRTQANAQDLIIPAYEAFHKGEFKDLITHSPFYLKNPNITLSKKRFF